MCVCMCVCVNVCVCVFCISRYLSCRYLNELMAENEAGWIRLSDLLAFPRMKTLCLPQVYMCQSRYFETDSIFIFSQITLM